MGQKYKRSIDPQGQPQVMACCNNCFHTCSPYVGSESSKSFETKQIFTSVLTVEWIIDVSVNELNQLIHSANPQSRLVVIIVFAHVVRSSVRPHSSFKTKQTLSENKFGYSRDCGSGRVDH